MGAIAKPLTRQNLSQSLNIHINTLRKYELLVKSLSFVLDENEKYLKYSDSAKNLDGIELSPYLAWLLVKIHNLRIHGLTFSRIKNELFMYAEYYQIEEFLRHGQRTKASKNGSHKNDEFVLSG